MRQLLASHPDGGRARLSQERCRRWDGRAPTAARKLWPVVPAWVWRSTRAIAELEHCPDPVAGALATGLPVEVAPVSCPKEQAHFECLLASYHYLGCQPTGGREPEVSRPRPPGAAPGLPAVGFRDREGAPPGHIHRLGRSDPGGAPALAHSPHASSDPALVRVPLPASHVLGQVVRRVAADWQRQYDHPSYLLETCIDRSRLRGTCYQSANWIRVVGTAAVGTTAGAPSACPPRPATFTPARAGLAGGAGAVKRG
ncbi:MAG TPA: hypothetical protein DCM14_00200 [Clostridiales bacterium UBA8153]|nr:hypothetical protein [Clostridiales bacterium UBA8153]